MFQSLQWYNMSATWNLTLPKVKISHWLRKSQPKTKKLLLTSSFRSSPVSTMKGRKRSPWQTEKIKVASVRVFCPTRIPKSAPDATTKNWSNLLMNAIHKMFSMSRISANQKCCLMKINFNPTWYSWANDKYVSTLSFIYLITYCFVD